MSDGRSVFGFQYTSVEEANAVAEGFKKALAPVQASQPLQSQPQQAHQQSQPQQTQVQHQPSGPVAPAAPAPSAPSAPSAPLAPSAPAAPSAPSAPVAPSASMSPPSGPPAPPSEPPSAPESDAGTSSLASALLNPDAPPPAAAAVKPPSPSKSEITKEKAEPKGASAPASIPNHSSQNPGIQPAQKSFDVGDMVKEMAAKKLNAQHALPAKSSINNNLNRVSSSTDNLSDNQMVLLKQEILKEIRKDLEEMKQEILAAIKSH